MLYIVVVAQRQSYVSGSFCASVEHCIQNDVKKSRAHCYTHENISVLIDAAKFTIGSTRNFIAHGSIYIYSMRDYNL